MVVEPIYRIIVTAPLNGSGEICKHDKSEKPKCFTPKGTVYECRDASQYCTKQEKSSFSSQGKNIKYEMETVWQSSVKKREKRNVFLKYCFYCRYFFPKQDNTGQALWTVYSWRLHTLTIHCKKITKLNELNKIKNTLPLCLFPKVWAKQFSMINQNSFSSHVLI